MSRRLRTEVIREKLLNVEIEEEESKLKQQQERIFGPLVWRRLPSGFRIEDLKPKYYEKVLDMIETDFLPYDVIFRNSKFSEDEESQKSYRERLLFNLKDRCSIILLEERRICREENDVFECTCDTMNTEKEDILAGVLVLKALKKSDMSRVFSRIQLTDGKSLKSILTFLNYLNKKVDIYEQFDCDMYLRYYLLCVKPEYRHKGLGFQLMNTGIDIARHLHIPIVMGVFDSSKLQKLANRLNMKTVFEVEYIRWVDKTGELIFCDPGSGNYTCAVMVGKVPPPPEPEPTQIVQEEPSKYKLTRSEKRKLLEKQKSKMQNGICKNTY